MLLFVYPFVFFHFLSVAHRNSIILSIAVLNAWSGVVDAISLCVGISKSKIILGIFFLTDSGLYT